MDGIYYILLIGMKYVCKICSLYILIFVYVHSHKLVGMLPCHYFRITYMFPILSTLRQFLNGLLRSDKQFRGKKKSLYIYKLSSNCLNLRNWDSYVLGCNNKIYIFFYFFMNQQINVCTYCFVPTSRRLAWAGEEEED